MINKWVIEGIHHTVCVVLPSHLLLCPYLDLWMSCSAHRPSGTSTSQASPSHTPTVPAVQVCVCACEFARLPAEAQLLSKCHHGECRWAHVVPVTHTAGLRYCVGTVSSVSVLIAVTPCSCNPRTETKWGFPSPHLLRHICQPVSLSICTSLYPLSARLWGVRHCTYQPGVLLSCSL